MGGNRSLLRREFTSEEEGAEPLSVQGSSSSCTSTLPSAFCTLTSPSTSLPAERLFPRHATLVNQLAC